MCLTKNEGSLTNNEGEMSIRRQLTVSVPTVNSSEEPCWYPVQTSSRAPFPINSELLQLLFRAFQSLSPSYPVSSTSLSTMAVLRMCILSHRWPFDVHLKHPISYLPAATLLPTEDQLPCLFLEGISPAWPTPQTSSQNPLLIGLFPQLPKPIYYKVILCLTCNYLPIYLSPLSYCNLHEAKHHTSSVFVNPLCLSPGSYSAAICNLY